MSDQYIETTKLLLGSETWVKAVYSSKPVREVDGRSRPTVRHYKSGTDSIHSIMEGGFEATTELLLKVLQKSGVISHWKHQPFELKEEIHGVNAVPDFMIDTTDGRRFVLEIKTERFITDEQIEHKTKINDAFKGTSILYLMWTDKWPLNPTVRHALNHMRRAYKIWSDIECFEKVHAALANRPMTIKELRAAPLNMTFDQIRAAVYNGYAYYNFFKNLDDETLVYHLPNLRAIETLFKATFTDYLAFRNT